MNKDRDEIKLAYSLLDKNLQGAEVLSEVIMEDDAKDYGRFDRVHHWHIGFFGKLLCSLARNYYSTKKELELIRADDDGK